MIAKEYPSLPSSASNLSIRMQHLKIVIFLFIFHFAITEITISFPPLDGYGHGLGLGDLLLSALSDGKMGKKFGKMGKFKMDKKPKPYYPSYHYYPKKTTTTTAAPTTTEAPTTTNKPCALNLYLKTHIIPEYHKY